MALVSYAKSMSDLAKKGARIAKQKGIKLDRMCGECACKWEQDRTLAYFIAADQAAQCLMSDTEFNCHTWDYRCADKPCAGFALAKLAIKEQAKQKLKKIKDLPK